MQQPQVSFLPDEIWCLIYTFLPISDKVTLKQICKYIHTIVTNQLAALSLMDLSNIYAVEPKEYNKLIPMRPGLATINGKPCQLCLELLPMDMICDSRVVFVDLFNKNIVYTSTFRGFRYAMMIGPDLYLMKENAGNEGNTHMLRETSVVRHLMNIAAISTKTCSNIIANVTTLVRTNPDMQYLVNYCVGNWIMVPDIATNIERGLPMTFEECAPWGRTMDTFVTGFPLSFISDITGYNKPFLISHDYLVFHLPNFETPSEDVLLVYNIPKKVKRTIKLPIEVTSYGMVDMIWVIEGATLKISRPGYIYPSTTTLDEPRFFLDIRQSNLKFDLVKRNIEDDLSILSTYTHGYYDQTLSLTHVNYYDNRLTLRVNAQIDRSEYYCPASYEDHILVTLYNGNTIIATWNIGISFLFEPIINSVMLSDEGHHIIVATNRHMYTLDISSIINKLTIPCSQ